MGYGARVTEPPLSRFAGQDPKPRPTHTVVVPGVGLASAVMLALLAEGEIFTVEPSPTQPEVWHLGVFESGTRVVLDSVTAMGW